MTIYRDDTNPIGKRVWEAIERAARNAPEWTRRKPRPTPSNSRGVRSEPSDTGEMKE